MVTFDLPQVKVDKWYDTNTGVFTANKTGQYSFILRSVSGYRNQRKQVSFLSACAMAIERLDPKLFIGYNLIFVFAVILLYSLRTKVCSNEFHKFLVCVCVCVGGGGVRVVCVCVCVCDCVCVCELLLLLLLLLFCLFSFVFVIVLFLIHMSKICIYVISPLRQSDRPAYLLSVLHSKTFKVGHYTQTFQPILFHTCHVYRHH